jgi:hypothetical protein
MPDAVLPDGPRPAAACTPPVTAEATQVPAAIDAATPNAMRLPRPAGRLERTNICYSLSGH